ncbi:RecQ family ATP-dependent DNA helicase [Aliifodinibius salicampi]|uniref:ATP-dependent DNA helicase RecQ n=1 Tax=Fodinibius salicampi TaxID=1920655 RepID=A0ABT3PY34_9BACT|nr:ATP-dependent DNA helicase RecQ [Fodinibius salicampi]MCW9712780.1 RecQ family ATP-dependent DNA helicase [Fodinibius salicampi]
MNHKTLTEAREALKKYWGYSTFREGQEEVIHAVLEQRDTMVLFPTGGGKSLCYQLPSVVTEGLTVVISPLVALMQDQVQQLNNRNIAATFINSSISSWEVEQRLVNARNGMYDLLYCAPERLQTTLWQAELPKLDINLIAIDEAHCISEWGHDFRPSYREIRPALESIAASVSWMALTATATPEVRTDIQNNLELSEPVVVSKGFDRPNLKWWVLSSEQKDQKMLTAVRRASNTGVGLIYAGTRRNCEELSSKIQKQLGIETESYHAGKEPGDREQIQQRWVEGNLPLVVATNAFGMGIDKADCRYVIHYEMPYSLEAYYQQAGRAGRDGEESFPLLLFKPSDLRIAEKRIKDSYPEREQLQRVYDALCDSLDLAVGSEMETAEELSIDLLSKRAGFSKRITRSALNVLNHLGIIELIEYITPRIGVHFIANRDYIRELISKSENERKRLFLDTLLRQFGGEAFAEMKYLDFDYVREKLNVSPNAVKKGLQVLQDHDQILQFHSRGDLPLVKLLEERQSVLRLSKKELEQHRNTLLKKLEYMQGYIETEGCREVYIRQYFGESQVRPCGHCDNCLSEKKGEVQFMDSDLLSIKQALSKGGKTIPHLCRQFGWSRSRVKKSLSYLIREEKVKVNEEKYIWANSTEN